jgi:hypothetical protein
MENRVETPENFQKPPTFMVFLPASLLLFLIGWGGLVALTYYTLPTLGPRWLFFFLVVLALTGTFLPVAYFINRRFPSRPPVGGEVIVRQALWFGIYASLITWLHMGRVLTPVLASILFIALILVEGLLRVWERSRWRPNS